MSYVYDAWGKPAITNVVGTTESGNLITRNPYLYRGYRYDHETGLYYLNSRYYDPETGRFVNGDVYASTGDSSVACNMFAYCLDNPVNMVDPSGDIAITTIILIASIIVGVAVAAYTACEMQSSGADVRDIIFYSLGNGILAFGTVYSVGTSAYGLYYTMCSIHGYTPVTQIGPTKGIDIGPATSTSAAPTASIDVAEQLQRCADDANKAISGTGHVAGSLKHTAFKNAVDALNNPIRFQVDLMCTLFTGQLVRRVHFYALRL